MAKSAWRSIPGSSARFHAERVERDGVAALRVRLRGASGNSADDVSRVRDALDDAAAEFEPEVEVAALDVSVFSNAYGDEAGILTSVFSGLACCWATPWWSAQVDGCRWDLPHSDMLAPTLEEALDRVVSWRRAGGYTLVYGDTTVEHRWTARGFESVTRRGGELDLSDLHHRNQMVERTIHGEREARVSWPFADRTGATHEALRRGARLVRERGRVVEVDLGPWQTRRPLGDDWVARVRGLREARELVLLATEPTEDDVLRAVVALPKLRLVRLSSERITGTLLARVRLVRPRLEVR